MLLKSLAPALRSAISSRFFASVTAHATPNELAYKFLLPRRIAVNGCSVDVRARELFQPQLMDDVVARVNVRAASRPSR